MTDFSSYKFRCSGLRHLMTNGRKKDELFGDTTKTYLRDIFIKETYGRDRSYLTKSKYTDKGTMVESDSLDLIEAATGEKHFKNLKSLENDFIKGTPDVILSDKIIDIKSSWDIWTFASVDEKRAKADYYYQLLGYMWLTGTKTSELTYCLNNTPEMLIADEMCRLSFKIGEENTEQYRVNFVFDDIDPKVKIKTFRFDFNELLVDEIKARVLAARDYLSQLHL